MRLPRRGEFSAWHRPLLKLIHFRYEVLTVDFQVEGYPILESFHFFPVKEERCPDANPAIQGCPYLGRYRGKIVYIPNVTGTVFAFRAVSLIVVTPSSEVVPFE